MVTKNFEQIGGVSIGLFDLKAGTLTVNGDTSASFVW
jgi:hypothetical protein